MKILIIEDTEPISKLLKLHMEKWKHKVTVVDTGKKALEIIKNEIFDLILMDIFLPDTVAYDLIPKMKKEWSGMNIITMTGYSSKDVEKKVRSHGIMYYMEKPVSLVELKSIIQHMNKKIEN
ncbi:response regulator [Desulfobacula phenolica]|uniref:Response regulator receiver domain-containing protein n=1 Tax=Desulfobacula phenolica TaxID=90732 RepID=A0A1H2HA03_9BACT|nr:response regulator [Desulfobacula phenolica]SDU28636.1 Response regulator receiver domain-containing protein [Desulfobacula phenolica]